MTALSRNWLAAKEAAVGGPPEEERVQQVVQTSLFVTYLRRIACASSNHPSGIPESSILPLYIWRSI